MQKRLWFVYPTALKTERGICRKKENVINKISQLRDHAPTENQKHLLKDTTCDVSSFNAEHFFLSFLCARVILGGPFNSFII